MEKLDPGPRPSPSTFLAGAQDQGGGHELAPPPEVRHDHFLTWETETKDMWLAEGHPLAGGRARTQRFPHSRQGFKDSSLERAQRHLRWKPSCPSLIPNSWQGSAICRETPAAAGRTVGDRALSLLLHMGWEG